jgi:hypothetical protein
MSNHTFSQAALILISFLSFVRGAPAMALLLPTMDKTTIGFDLTDEERNDFDNKIIKIIKKSFKTEISAFSDRDKFMAAPEPSAATFFIENFYIGYDIEAIDVPVRSGHIAVRVHMFPDKQKHMSEVVAAKATGSSGFGRNNPFESALKETFEKIQNRKFYSSAKTDSISTLSDVLNLKDVYPCSTTVLLVEPELSASTMLYEMLPEEQSDFSHQLADALSDLTHSPVRLASRIAIDSLKECCKIHAEIKFSRKDHTILLDLTNGYDPGKSLSEVCIAKNADDWNENKEFTKDIFKAFKQFKKKYPGK